MNPTLVVSMVLATWAISTTIAVAKVFEPLRRFVQTRVNEFAYEGISCQRCVSHWVAASLVAIYRPRLVESPVLIVDLFVTAMAIVAASDLIARCTNLLKR